ncbi:MAG: beta-ketoacyl-ACP synthase III [Pseudomonadota bacterium]
MNAIRSVVQGCGAYLPQKIITNDDLARRLDTSDEWIRERSGIGKRHIAAEDERTSDLGLAASRHALERAEMDAKDIDLIIVATATPDQTFPATATTIQAQLGITHGAAFDLQAVCSGFVYAMSTADNFLKSGQHKCALVIGAETFSRILDWEDRSTCVLFGDGAGAVILKAEQGTASCEARGVITSRLYSDGRYNDKLYVDGGPSSTQTVGHLRMSGRDVYKHAVINIAAAIQDTLEESNISADDIDWFVPHQANKRILESTAKKIGLSAEKIVMTIENHANTSAASIPLALDAAIMDGRLKREDLVLLEAMGGGFTWGASLIKW